MAKRITTKQLEGLRVKHQTLSESLRRPGSLLARRLSSGTCWRYQYRHEGKLKRYTFGMFSARGNNTGESDAGEYTLVGARLRAEALAALTEQVGDLNDHMAEVRLEATAARQSAKDTRQAELEQARTYSLRKLCEAYWQHLEQEGKRSAPAVRNALENWVIKRHPSISAKKAANVTTEDALTILRDIIEAGHTTQTNRVRSYLSAAFSFGIGSATDPLASHRASGFRLTMNPVAPIKRVAQFERAGQRTLNRDEMAHLMRSLQQRSNPAARCVELAIRLGGQRPQQLLEVVESDIDTHADTVTLRDPKGRRTQAREHLLPLVREIPAELIEAALRRHPRRTNAFGGLVLDTVSKLVREISREGEQDGAAPYSWRDVRRTCETMLAAMRVSKDVRAQIQSHGLGGVQARHYDRHDYMREKQAALSEWNRSIDKLLYNDENHVTNVLSITRN